MPQKPEKLLKKEQFVLFTTAYYQLKALLFADR